ncbi:MAG: endonuclease V, partial [Thermodesulfobacteriota bacterium]
DIGAVLRTRDKVKPVFVSIGNRIDLATSVKLALKCSRGYRIPEPTRQADKYVAELKQEINL